jgi:hypothetical protein
MITHFLNKNFKNQSPLIGIRRVKSSYNKKNITEAIIPVLMEINIISKLRYFTTNNHCVNDVTIKFILKHLRLNITYLRKRRVRYLDYIINFAVKAFLFNKDKDFFKDVYINNAVSVTALEVKITF